MQRPAPVSSQPAPTETAPAVDTKPKPPPFPVVAAAANETTPPPLPATPPPLPPPPKFDSKPGVPHLRALQPQQTIDDKAAKEAAPKPVTEKKGKSFLAPVAVIVLVIGGLVGFRFYRQATRTVIPPPAPAPAAAAKTPPATSPSVNSPATVAATPAPAPKTPAAATSAASTKPAIIPNPTPSETLNTLAHAPARAIAKAQAVVDAQRGREQERVDAFGGTGTDSPVPQTPAPKPVAAKPAAPVTATSQVAPGVTATTAVSAGGSATASAELRSWVASARLSGLFVGANPRALINGRMVQPGQIVDDTLKVTFDRIEPDGKTLVFRDASGATVSRKF